MNMAVGKMAGLPLFPLQTVLFPGGRLPLLVFEVRYLDMIGKCHKAGDPFGVVCLTKGSDTRRRDAGADGSRPGDGFVKEAFHSVGTLARITRLERPQPGMMQIDCVGSQRFRVERSEQLRHGLWVADVEWLADDQEVPVPGDLAFTRDGLKRVLHDSTPDREQNDSAHSELVLPEPHRWDDCGWLANRWCEMLPLEPGLKQRFMALDSPVLRLEMVADALGQMGFEVAG